MLEYIVGVKGLVDWIPLPPREFRTRRYYYYVNPGNHCQVLRKRRSEPRTFNFPARVVAVLPDHCDSSGALAILANQQVYYMYNSRDGRVYYRLLPDRPVFRNGSFNLTT